MSCLSVGAGCASAAAAARCRSSAALAGGARVLPPSQVTPAVIRPSAAATAIAPVSTRRGPMSRRILPPTRRVLPGGVAASASSRVLARMAASRAGLGAGTAANVSWSSFISSIAQFPSGVGRVGGSQDGAYVAAGPYQPRRHRAHRDSKSAGDLLVAESAGSEQQHIAVRLGQGSDRLGELAANRAGRRAVGGLVGDGLGRHRVEPGARDRTEQPYLVAAVPPDQVGCDAEQPRAGVGLPRVVAIPAPERGQERLGNDVVGYVRAEAAGDVTVDRRSVPVE